MNAFTNGTASSLDVLADPFTVAVMLTPGLYLLRALGAVLQWQAAGPVVDGVRFVDLNNRGADLQPWYSRQDAGHIDTEILAGLVVMRETNLSLSVWSANGTAEVRAVRLQGHARGFLERGPLPHLTIDAVGFSVEDCRIPNWGVGSDYPLSVVYNNGVIFNLMSAMRLQFGGSSLLPNPTQVHLLAAGLPALQFRYRVMDSGCEDLFTFGQLNGVASFVVYTDKTFRIGSATLRLKPDYYLAFRPVIKSIFDLAFCSPDVPADTKRHWGWTSIDYGRWPVQLTPFAPNENYGFRGMPLLDVNNVALRAEAAEEETKITSASVSGGGPHLAVNASNNGA